MKIQGNVPLKPGDENSFVGFSLSFLRSLNGVIRQQKSQKVLKHFYWERLGRSERRYLAALLSSLTDSLESHQVRLRNSDNRDNPKVRSRATVRGNPPKESQLAGRKDQSEGPSTGENQHEHMSEAALARPIEETRLGRLMKSLE